MDYVFEMSDIQNNVNCHMDYNFSK